MGKKTRQWRMGYKAGIKSCQPTIRQLQVEIDFADTYCKVCGSCGHDGCCPAERCAYPSIKAETVTEFKEMFDKVHGENKELLATLQQLVLDVKAYEDTGKELGVTDYGFSKSLQESIKVLENAN